MSKLVPVITNKRIVIKNETYTNAETATLAYARASAYKWYLRNMIRLGLFHNDSHCHKQMCRTAKRVKPIFEKYFQG